MPDLIDRVDLGGLTAPEQGNARDLQAALHDGTASVRKATGEVIEIPAALAELFETLARAAANGDPVSVRIGGSDLLTARQAAEELGISRTHLCKLMDTGEIEGTRAGTHRRISVDAIEAYRSARAAAAAVKYRDAVAGVPDVPDAPMPILEGAAPPRPR